MLLEVMFRATKTSLTKASMQFFMKGLFGSKDAVPVQHAPDNDALLMAFDMCKKWQTEVKNSRRTEMEGLKFRAGPEFQNLLQSVSRRLGFKHNITYDSVAIMYDMCRYQKAWEIDRVSPWCAVFSDSEIPVLEYHEDLNLYYKTGAGHSLNAQMGCPLMQDMFQHFKKLESANYSGNPRGIFYFSNTKTFQPFMVAMGIAKDSTPLLSTNYQSMRNRQWRSSKIASFANNIVAVFYKCKTGDPNRVMFYQAEKPLLYEGCEKGLCDWEYLKNKLGDAAFSCSLDFCDLDSEALAITLTSIEFLTAMLVPVVFRSGHF